jgi:hypothetical protein
MKLLLNTTGPDLEELFKVAPPAGKKPGCSQSAIVRLPTDMSGSALAAPACALPVSVREPPGWRVMKVL